jgi:hypothetical protein
MKFKHYIQEEYYDVLKDYSGNELPVFINPDKKEVRECGRHIRFIIDLDHNQIYTWNAYKAIHGVVVGKLGLHLHKHIRGEAVLKDNKMWFDQGEAYNITKNEIRSKNWINKYLDLEYLLNNVDFPHS